MDEIDYRAIFVSKIGTFYCDIQRDADKDPTLTVQNMVDLIDVQNTR